MFVRILPTYETVILLAAALFASWILICQYIRSVLSYLRNVKNRVPTNVSASSKKKKRIQ